MAGDTACLLLHSCCFRMRCHSCQHAANSAFLGNLGAVGGVLVSQLTETHARLLLHRCRVCVCRHRREKLFDAPAAGVGVTEGLTLTYYIHTYVDASVYTYVQTCIRMTYVCSSMRARGTYPMHTCTRMYRHAYVWHTFKLFYARARSTYPPATILPLLAATKLESAPHACSWSPKAYT